MFNFIVDKNSKYDFNVYFGYMKRHVTIIYCEFVLLEFNSASCKFLSNFVCAQVFDLLSLIMCLFFGWKSRIFLEFFYLNNAIR